jgi:hypothetical protein
MHRSMLTQVAAASAALVAGSIWLGVATATALVFMVVYALQAWKTA